MTAEPFALTHPGPGDRSRETDHADREDDPTPRGVVRAALEAAELVDAMPEEGRLHIRGAGFSTQGLMAEPVRVLDVCAGYGCWASEIRRLAGLQGWPVHITGVELFEPRRADLAKWCDEVGIGDWRELIEGDAAFDGDHGPYGFPHGYDIAIGNPHFTALTHEDPEQSMPAVLLRHAPAVLLLHTQQAFARGEAGRRAWRAYPPAASWMVPGSVKFRTGVNPKCPRSSCGHRNEPGETHCQDYDPNRASNKCGAKLKMWGSDQRCYQVSLWLRGHEGPTALHMLPELDAAARRWTVPPGSEQPCADLPAAPGWAP